MASVKKRPNGKWRARYRDPEGSEHSRHFDRRVDAERWLDSVRGDLARGTYVDPDAGRCSFGDYAQQWLGIQVHRPSTAAKLDSDLRNHVLPFLGHRPIGAIRHSEIQAWVKNRSEVLAPATVEVIYRYLASLFRAAVSDRVIPVSPCSQIRLPKKAVRQVSPLPTEHVKALIDAMPDRYRALAVLAAGAGLRQGEAFGLRVPAVDFLRRSIAVEQQLVCVTGRPPFLAAPKTAASCRTVPAPRVVIDALAQHLTAYPPCEDSLVFTAHDGGPIRRNRFGEIWAATVSRAGLPKGTHFHDLRHYYASLLIRHGESVKVVQARLGHASAQETLDTYGHLWPDSDARTRAAVDKELGALEPAEGSDTGLAEL